MGLVSFSSYRSDRLLDAGLLALRVGAGFRLFWLHGWSKLTAATGYVFQGQEWGFVAGVAGLGFPLQGVFAVAAALAESIGSLLVSVGLLTRVSAGFVGFTMLVAIYRHFRAGELAELGSLYLLGAVVIGLGGAGRYSLDGVFVTRGAGEVPGGELGATALSGWFSGWVVGSAPVAAAGGSVARSFPVAVRSGYGIRIAGWDASLTVGVRCLACPDGSRTRHVERHRRIGRVSIRD